MLIKGIKRWWMNFLKHLAKENEKNFGQGPLECCTLKDKGKTNDK